VLKTIVSQGEDVECNRCGYSLTLGERYTYEALSGTVVRCPNCPPSTEPNGGPIMWPNSSPAHLSNKNNCNESVMPEAEEASTVTAQVNNTIDSLWKAIANLQKRLEKLQSAEATPGSSSPAKKGLTKFYSVLEARGDRKRRISKDHKDLTELLNEVIQHAKGEYEITKAGIKAGGRDFSFYARRPNGKTDRLFGAYLAKVISSAQSKAA